MSIALDCGSWGTRLKVGDNLSGGEVKCPRCGSQVAVPEEEPEDRPARKARPAQADEEDEARPLRRRPRAEDDEDEDRPRRKKRPARRGGKKGLIVGLSVGGGVLVVGGAVLLIVLLGGSRDNPNVTEENFDKIKQDMPVEEVEKVLGKGEKVSYGEVSKALHTSPPKGGYGSDADTLKWKNKGETILLVVHPNGTVMHGWFVREQKSGKPKYKLLGFGKLE